MGLSEHLNEKQPFQTFCSRVIWQHEAPEGGEKKNMKKNSGNDKNKRRFFYHMNHLERI